MASPRRRVMSSASGSSNMIAAMAEASTILTSISFIAHFTDNLSGLARCLEAQFPDLCQELVGGQPPWRPHRLLENCKDFALHRAVIPLGLRLQKRDEIVRSVFDRQIDRHRNSSKLALVRSKI